LEENDIIFINQGLTNYTPPEPLVALYPAEGTFVHDHPYAIPNADWVTDEQRAAALIFREYVLSKTVQEQVLAAGFRPVNPEVAMGYPFVPELGVDPDQPKTVLETPSINVIKEVQQNWSYVKKKADIWLVIDVSSSMQGEKLDKAKEAALAFVKNIDPSNRVGLIVFSNGVQVQVPLDVVEKNQAELEKHIGLLYANGGTALFDALNRSIDLLTEIEGERIRAVVLLSDGQDTTSTLTLNAITDKIKDGQNTPNPVIVLPVAYGDDADRTTLDTIAEASKTRVKSGDPSQIQQILQDILSFF
jgi:Ca-activated chloride channel homolog